VLARQRRPDGDETPEPVGDSAPEAV